MVEVGSSGNRAQLTVLRGRILASLSSVGSRRCRSFHRKLVASDPKPFSCARLQLVSQSVLGEAHSALHLMYSLGPSSGSTMVIFSSTRTVYQSARDIVATFSGVPSLTSLIMEKNEAG